MPSFTQHSFAAGEIAPSLYGRTDLIQFAAGLKACRNFIVARNGGVQNRSGSEFIGKVRNSEVRTYLTKLIYSISDAYLLEVGEHYFRFWRFGEAVLTATLDAPYEVVTPYAEEHLAMLRFSQSGATVIITHEAYAPRQLRRTGASTWVLELVATTPSIAAPAGFSAASNGGTGRTYRYRVSAIAADTYEESLPSAIETVISSEPTPTAPNPLLWLPVPGAVEYNIYADWGDGNGFGLIGINAFPTFNDVGYTPDLTYAPQMERVLFNATGNYPRSSGYYQQRLIFASTIVEPEKLWTSQIGAYRNFSIRSPIQDDDAVTWVIAGLSENEIRYMIEMNRLFVFGAAGLWMIRGDDQGTLTPSAIYPQRVNQYGAAPHAGPIIAGFTIIYLQARGQVLRGLVTGTNFDDVDLTINARHLFDPHTLLRYDYAELPSGIVWGVRSDGRAVSLTYAPQQNVAGWAQHETKSGAFEDVCTVPEGEEDAVYVIVNRPGGRYIERFASRRFQNVRDGKFLDSYLTYDGRNTSSILTMTLSAAPGWTVNDLITVTASGGAFLPSDVGNAIAFLGPGDTEPELLRVTIDTVVSVSVAKGYPSKDVPVEMQGVATSRWARAVDEVGGLDHLEGLTVGIKAYGDILPFQVVHAGKVTFGYPRWYVDVGLPILAYIQTLDLERAQAELRDRRKLLRSLSMVVESTRGLFAGPDPEHLYEYKPEITQYLTPPALLTETIEIPITASWNLSGSVFVLQEDALPVSILNVIPSGDIGG